MQRIAHRSVRRLRFPADAEHVVLLRAYGDPLPANEGSGRALDHLARKRRPGDAAGDHRDCPLVRALGEPPPARRSRRCALVLRFDAVSGDRFAGVDEERLEGIALILQAIDLTIVAVEARDDGDSREQLATLRYMRERWREKADEEAER